MSYFSNVEDRSSIDGLGCGPGCGCGPCSGLSEWYEKEEEEELPEGVTSRIPSPNQSPTAARSLGEYPNRRPGFRLGFYHLHDADEPAAGPETPSAAAAVGPQASSDPEAIGPQTSCDVDQRLLQSALRSGIRNLRQLTDMIFFARHPSLKGGEMFPSETETLAERRQIREGLVLPALRHLFRPRVGASRRHRVRPPALHGFSHFGFGEPPPLPICASARNDLATVATDLRLINNELAKGAGASAARLDLKKRLLVLDVDGMIGSLDAYIVSGCCEPALKTLESEVQTLPWPVSVGPTRVKLLNEIVAAQGRARKDSRHC